MSEKPMSAMYFSTPREALAKAAYWRKTGDNDVVIQFCYPVGKSSDGQWVVGRNQGWEHSDEELAENLVRLGHNHLTEWIRGRKGGTRQ